MACQNDARECATSKSFSPQSGRSQGCLPDAEKQKGQNKQAIDAFRTKKVLAVEMNVETTERDDVSLHRKVHVNGGFTGC